jgi:hypothetical protein
MALFAEDLVTTCGHDDCDCVVGTHENPMNFNSKCHPKRPFHVSAYDGLLELHCAACGELVATVAVARRGGTA